MKFHEFVQKVQTALEQETGKKVRIIESLKSNEVTLVGVCIQTGYYICPAIYLNSCYHKIGESCGDDDIQKVVHAVLEVHREYEINEPYDPEMLLDFDGIKDRICYKLLHYESDRRLLENAVYEKALDLAKTACLPKQGVTGTILVTMELCSFWKVEPEEVLALMSENTAKVFPPVLEASACFYSIPLRFLKCPHITYNFYKKYIQLIKMYAKKCVL